MGGKDLNLPPKAHSGHIILLLEGEQVCASRCLHHSLVLELPTLQML